MKLLLAQTHVLLVLVVVVYLCVWQYQMLTELDSRKPHEDTQSLLAAYRTLLMEWGV